MPHPSVDWLYPLLAAVQGVEESLLHPTASHLPWSGELAEQVRGVQCAGLMWGHTHPMGAE